jgi:hypothetical protein
VPPTGAAGAGRPTATARFVVPTAMEAEPALR